MENEKLNEDKEVLLNLSTEMSQVTSSAAAMAIKAYMIGRYDGIDTIKDAIKWFKETHNTVYIMYDEGSLDHLINLYNEAKANK